MNQLIYHVGLLLSSFVSVHIIMEFMGNIFDRVYEKKVYYLSEVAFIIILAAINKLNNEWLNLFTVIGVSSFIAVKLYTGDITRKLIFNIILIICMSACESIGIAALHFTYHFTGITVTSQKLTNFFDITISQVLVLLISHLAIIKIAMDKKLNNLTNKQFLYSFIYAVFSIINIYSLSILIRNVNNKGEIICVLITITGIVIINIYFLNILEYESENNRLLYDNQLFLQQSRMQYQYYDNLELQYRESLSIIHDVKRHIRAIEELYYHKENETAKEYSIAISSRLNAFYLNEYTNNRVLNIILNDKIKISEQNGIEFNCKLDDIDLSFIENMDLTTIFANLLDNAIEACKELDNKKIIQVQVGSFNNLVAITIKNTMRKPVTSTKHNLEPYGLKWLSQGHKSSELNHRGIGIPNVMKVINKYNGDFDIREEGDMFICSIVLSREGRKK